MKTESQQVHDYNCPNCGEWPSDNDLGYEVDGEHYPKTFNQIKGSSIDGNYHYWDEFHRCENCKTKYWFQNSGY